ncbi:MAG TPA: tripartite tricarboxylate transporter substrate binding protein [Ramlibacter sp.]|jgi:tripartite-type tricarboxylate transporter receptor subunit TctC|uniref:Bug family tripartite tricarboxylate transporter substrate binding protein n=1 Tax=Ramlibacter sp. TaxID=1917967 RepID=UPI002D229091|nr:tripartite tricarboxylate transporter substrate binding protein [Ramlibacter sp.]HZY19131.1 tripartite tricarboxylate transporter substrate binding protein [Ramlibacter sp.]
MTFRPTRRQFDALLLASLCTPALAQTTPPATARPRTPQPSPAAAKPGQPAMAPLPGAENWPSKPVRLLVGFPPGSVQDISARIVAEPLSKALGQPVIVENKAGASGTIAGDQVARSSDQHTFGVMNNSQLTIAKLLNPATAYDPARDLMPVALIGTTPMLLVVSNSAAGSTPGEWLVWLRNQGSHANYGSPGNGTPGHLGMELLKSRASFDATHVPYQGNPQIITAMIGGQLQAALLPPGLAMQQVRAGKMRAVGVTSEQRSLLAPEQPTLREVGVLGADIELWTAMAGPASLPPAVRDKMSAALIAVLRSEDVRGRLLTSGWQPTASNHEGLRLRMRNDTKTFGGIIMLRNIKADA